MNVDSLLEAEENCEKSVFTFLNSISSAESHWINENVYSPVSYENLRWFSLNDACELMFRCHTQKLRFTFHYFLIRAFTTEVQFTFDALITIFSFLITFSRTHKSSWKLLFYSIVLSGIQLMDFVDVLMFPHFQKIIALFFLTKPFLRLMSQCLLITQGSKHWLGFFYNYFWLWESPN